MHLSPDVHSQTLFHKRQQHFLMARVSSAVQCALSDHNSDLAKRDVIQSEPEHDAWWQRVPLLFIGV